jgi:hypothetical protein
MHIRAMLYVRLDWSEMCSAFILMRRIQFLYVSELCKSGG